MEMWAIFLLSRICFSIFFGLLQDCTPIKKCKPRGGFCPFGLCRHSWGSYAWSVRCPMTAVSLSSLVFVLAWPFPTFRNASRRRCNSSREGGPVIHLEYICCRH